MKLYLTVLFIGLQSIILLGQNETDSPERSQEEINKEIARNFYEDLWFNNRTENYKKYVADEYVVHDTGDRKNKTEQAIQQKHIADMFWNEGQLSGEIDYQIADGDLVATRWHSRFEPETLKGKLFVVDGGLPIINVFRFKDGKIVEFWNHRHDIDTSKTLQFTIRGLLVGLAIALIPTIFAIKYRRRLNKLNTNHQ